MAFVPDENQTEKISFRVRGRVEGNRIDQYLKKRFTEYSRSFFQKLIQQGNVLIDQKIARRSTKIRAGQEVEIFLPKLEALHLKAEDISLDIIYEDEHLIIINKKAGMVIHPSRGHLTGTIVNALIHHLNQDDFCAHPGIVHRLDRFTTGILLVAKNQKMNADLSQQFENRYVQKEYLALLEGRMRSKKGKIELPLGIDPKNRERVTVREDGKMAITEYEVLAHYPKYTLVHIFLKTGRTHQIRVHFSSQKHPLVADELYDAKPTLMANDISEELDDTILFSRQALHAWRLTFKHPVLDKVMTFVAPLPQDFFASLNLLQSLWPSPKINECLKAKL